jgi:uncharacterized membrane-anchored protein
MRTGLIAAVALIVLLGGTVMGIAAIFVLPIVGGIALLALILYALGRRADNRPPMP